MDDETTAVLQATLRAPVAPGAQLIDVARRATGEQGFSGATLRYFDVTYTQAGAVGRATLVIKDAPLLERRIQAWLGDRGLPVAFGYAPDLMTDAVLPLCMQYIADAPAPSVRAGFAAQALAAIHHAALGLGETMPWLPSADPAFLADWLIEACWRRGWRSVLAGRGLVDAYGRHSGPPKPGGDFGAAFAAYTEPLEDAAARFLRDMTALWAAGDALTLIHGDLHDQHVRVQERHAYVIDWGQARYGPLYLDLPNLFSREDASHYHASLAALGHVIPPDEFLARYDAARAYVGFKYFGIGLWDWCYGDPPHRPERVQYWINLALQL